MIPTQNIVAWGQTVPWAEQRQIEQDLMISRALVAIFNNPLLKEQLRFRGGTALNKLHLNALRYSGRYRSRQNLRGPIGAVLDALRNVLEPWLGHANFEASSVAPKLRFRIEPEDKSAIIRVKVEMNTAGITAYDPPITIPFEVKNPWFTGRADIPTLPARKSSRPGCALLQRDKGRDLIDLPHAKDVFDKLDTRRVVRCFGKYLAASGHDLRAQAEERMFAKLAKTAFHAGRATSLSADEAENSDDKAARAVFRTVFSEFIKLDSSQAWAKSKEAAERVGMVDLV